MAASWWRWWRRPAEVPQAPEPWQAGDSAPAEIYARALLKRAEISEEYFVEQEISRNSSAKPGRSPVGRIDLAMPYDGHKYFTRAARADVAHQTPPESGLAGTAVIGHLLLKDYPPIHLQDEVDPGGRYGAIAIKVPLGNGAPGDLEQLSADQRICTAAYGFRPDDAAVIPARLEIDLFDPDSLDLPPADLRVFDLDTDEARRGINDGIAKIVRHVRFEDGLVLQIVVHASLPAPAEPGRPGPRVARVAIRWPTITSLDSLRLNIPAERPRLGVPLKLKDTPFGYNPFTGCVEWRDVPMDASDEKAEAPDSKPDGAEKGAGAESGEKPTAEGKPQENGKAGGKGESGKGKAEKPKESKQEKEPEKTGKEDGERGAGIILRYQSRPMLLMIRHPGELYKQEDLEVTAEVEVPDYLISGMTARVYDATGYFLKDPLTLRTRIQAHAKLTLDDAFAMRDRSPSQHLFFDEIIPDEIRIDDIRTALMDRGFVVKKVWPPDDASRDEEKEETETDSWLLVAHRKVGPDDMILWVFAEGRHSGTDRDRVMPGGGVLHRTWLPSGELRIVIRGSLPGDSKGRLTQEINVLHGMLWERYARLRQQR